MSSEDSDKPSLEPRDLSADPVAMRALAHPLRLRLLEYLTLSGPKTATECSEEVGESPASCSFHLRTLAKYGFVEEAPGGRGRQRPWQVVSLGNRWSSTEADAGERAAGALLATQVRNRDSELLGEFLASQDSFPREWQQATIHSNFASYLTAEELDEIGSALLELWQPYLARLRDPSARPPGSRLVHMYAHGFPRADHSTPDPSAPQSEGEATDA
jgi:hypothetical protein